MWTVVFCILLPELVCHTIEFQHILQPLMMMMLIMMISLALVLIYFPFFSIAPLEPHLVPSHSLADWISHPFGQLTSLFHSLCLSCVNLLPILPLSWLMLLLSPSVCSPSSSLLLLLLFLFHLICSCSFIQCATRSSPSSLSSLLIWFLLPKWWKESRMKRGKWECWNCWNVSSLPLPLPHFSFSLAVSVVCALANEEMPSLQLADSHSHSFSTKHTADGYFLALLLSLICAGPNEDKNSGWSWPTGWQPLWLTESKSGCNVLPLLFFAIRTRLSGQRVSLRGNKNGQFVPMCVCVLTSYFSSVAVFCIELTGIEPGQAGSGVHWTSAEDEKKREQKEEKSEKCVTGTATAATATASDAANSQCVCTISDALML